MIDWQRVTMNLRRVKPLSAVAKQIGAEEKHINRLARGEVNQPRFNTGIALLNLHFDLCPDRHDERLYL